MYVYIDVDVDETSWQDYGDIKENVFSINSTVLVPDLDTFSITP
jgi:hypothetical protein